MIHGIKAQAKMGCGGNNSWWEGGRREDERLEIRFSEVDQLWGADQGGDLGGNKPGPIYMKSYPGHSESGLKRPFDIDFSISRCPRALLDVHLPLFRKFNPEK